MADTTLLGILQGKQTFTPTNTIESGSPTPKHDTWEPYFESASKDYGISKSLLKATAAFENPAADPYAESGTGAAGPMQITRGTAKGLGISEEDRYKPEIAIPAAAKLYRELLDHYNGDEVKAIAAYQVGQNVVDSAGGPSGGDKNMSNEAYVQKVLSIRNRIKQHELSKLFSNDSGLKSILTAAPSQTEPVQPLQQPAPAQPSPMDEMPGRDWTALSKPVTEAPSTTMVTESTGPTAGEAIGTGLKAAGKGAAKTAAAVGNFAIGPTIAAWRKDNKSPLDESVKAWELTEQEQKDLQEAGLLGQGVATVGELAASLPLYVAASAAGGASVGAIAPKVMQVASKLRPDVARALVASAGDAFGFSALGGAKAAGEGKSTGEVAKAALQEGVMGGAGRAAGEAANILTQKAGGVVQRLAQGTGQAAGAAAGTVVTGATPEEIGANALLGMGMGIILHHPATGKSIEISPKEPGAIDKLKTWMTEVGTDKEFVLAPKDFYNAEALAKAGVSEENIQKIMATYEKNSPLLTPNPYNRVIEPTDAEIAARAPNMPVLPGKVAKTGVDQYKPTEAELATLPEKTAEQAAAENVNPSDVVDVTPKRTVDNGTKIEYTKGEEPTNVRPSEQKQAAVPPELREGEQVRSREEPASRELTPEEEQRRADELGDFFAQQAAEEKLRSGAVRADETSAPGSEKARQESRSKIDGSDWRYGDESEPVESALSETSPETFDTKATESQGKAESDADFARAREISAAYNRLDADRASFENQKKIKEIVENAGILRTISAESLATAGDRNATLENSRWIAPKGTGKDIDRIRMDFLADKGPELRALGINPDDMATPSDFYEFLQSIPTNRSLREKRADIARREKDLDDYANEDQAKFSDQTGDLFGRSEGEQRIAEARTEKEANRKAKQRENPLEGTMFDANEMEARATKQEDAFAKQADEDLDIIDETGVQTKGYAKNSSLPGLASNRELSLSEKPTPEVEVQKAKPISNIDIAKNVSDLFELPIRTGRFRQKALGIFKVKPRVIRVDKSGNLPVISHELGHGLERFVLRDMMADSSRWGKAKQELQKLGKDLYGDRKPPGGNYTTEGFAEYWKAYLATDDAAKKVAPTVHDYMENVFFKDNPEFRNKLNAIRDQIKQWRGQGFQARISANIEGGKDPSILEKASKALSMENFVEPAWELKRMMDFVKVKKGENIANYDAAKQRLIQWRDDYLKKHPGSEARVNAKFDARMKKIESELSSNKQELPTSQDPYEATKNLRKLAPAMARAFALEGVRNSKMQQTAPALSGAIDLVKGYKDARKTFGEYLIARRAQEYHSLGYESGFVPEDVNNLVRMYDTQRPEYKEAAKIVHDFNRAVFDYAAEMSELPKDVVDKVKAKWDFYVPFERIVEKSLGPAGGKGKSRILYKVSGGAEKVRDPFEAMLRETERLIDASHKKYVFNRIIALKDIEGMGRYIEEIPKDQLPVTIELDKIKKQLEEAGVDLEDADLESLLTTYIPAMQTPKGHPIVAHKDGNTTKWYYFDKDLFEAIERMSEIPALNPIIEFVAAKPARAFKLFTTGVRASFAVANPARDWFAAIIQKKGSHSPQNLARFVGSGAKANVGQLLSMFGAKKTEINALREALGIDMALPLGQDIKHVRRASKELFQGKVARIVTHPIDMLRDFVGIPESGPRSAAIESMLKEKGWDINNLTLDQVFQLRKAASEVTTDFRPVGAALRKWGQVTPFLSANINGKRQFIRAWRDNPKAAVAIGMATMTIPALVNWYRNKDEEWYRNLNDEEKIAYTNIQMGDEIIRVPKAYEWSHVFQTLPELIIDGMYKKDPKGTLEFVHKLIGSEIPDITPHVAKAAREQLQNKVEFTGRPIVSKSDVDKPLEEQYGPYTSNMAIAIGKALKLSPDRIDHLIRNALGGIGSDVISATRAETIKGEKEPANLPVIGRFFRWGGKYSMRNKPIDDFYEYYSKYSRLANSDDPVKSQLSKQINKSLKDSQAAMKLLREAYNKAETKEKRQAIAILTTRFAKRAVDNIKAYDNNKRVKELLK